MPRVIYIVRMRRSSCCAKVGLKKGPWTLEEDRMLMAHVRQYGPGNWRELPAKAGLERCGKSCRLRWINYLRPDIKRGKISFQEEQTIIQLHALLGNRWSAIARHLPKRTDNEIKNYWNTHLKKRLIKMGIDPITHKPVNSNISSSNTEMCHLAQWESVRLQAESRHVREPRDLFRNSSFRPNEPQIDPSFSLPSFPYVDVLKVWQTQTGFLTAHTPTHESLPALSNFSDNSTALNFGVEMTRHNEAAVFMEHNLESVDSGENMNYWNDVLDLADDTSIPLF